MCGRYCPECKTDTSEVILAGEKMRITKKKANMVSRKSGSGRDWGKVHKAILCMYIVCANLCTNLAIAFYIVVFCVLSLIKIICLY